MIKIPLFRRAHYIFLAKILKEARKKEELTIDHNGDNWVEYTISDLINDLVKEFRRDNSAFKKDRFLDACYNK